MQFIFQLEGRMGNHFYIIAAMIYVMKKYNIDCKLFIQDYVKCQNLNHLYKNLEEHIIDKLPKVYIPIYESFNPDDIEDVLKQQSIKCRDNSIDLDEFIKEYNTEEYSNSTITFTFCFFQTDKYFLEYKDDIKKIFLVETENTLKYKNLISEDDVFISVRRGDYITACFYVLTNEYYIDMYNEHFSGKNIYISSDDINWCKENLPIEKFNNCNNITYLEDLDVLELYTIGTYFTNYICANSTFSSACELSSEHNQKSIGIKNVAADICRHHMFSKNCIAYNVIENDKYKKYIDDINGIKI